MDAGIRAFEKKLRPQLKRFLEDVRNTSGQASAKKLKQALRQRHASISALGYRAAEPAGIAGFAFDRTNPRAQEWVDAHAAETIDGINETTRESIKDLIDHAFEGEFDVHDLADEVTELIGDPNRAELIARTETLRASNEGQQEAWLQAVDVGLLTGTENREWIVTPDDRLCLICEPMDGQTVALDEAFELEDGTKIDVPPAHPRCRCTMGISL
jgi:SPP1 gp7 family putative phage head morphogenesis protein